MPFQSQSIKSIPFGENWCKIGASSIIFSIVLSVRIYGILIESYYIIERIIAFFVCGLPRGIKKNEYTSRFYSCHLTQLMGDCWKCPYFRLSYRKYFFFVLDSHSLSFDSPFNFEDYGYSGKKNENSKEQLL